jgi:hypothetical protein
MTNFSLLEYCRSKHLKYKHVKIWLLLYTREVRILNEMQSEDKILEIKMAIGEGEKKNFAVEELPEKVKSLQFLDYLIKKEQKKSEYNKPNDINLNELYLVELNKKLSTIEDEIFGLYKTDKVMNIGRINILQLDKSKLLIEKNTLTQLIGEAELKEKDKNQSISRLKSYSKVRNKLYQSLPTSVKKQIEEATNKVEAKTVESQKEASIIPKEIKLKQTKNLPLEIESKPVTHFDTKTSEIPWSNITFGEKYIWIKLNGKFFKRYPMDKSKIAFNQIKDIYNDRNLPMIKIEYSGGNVTNILNSDVLFYFFLFLENSGQDFSVKNIPDLIKSYSHFTKSFYQKNLRQLFTPRCFNYLIDVCSDHLPIIPIPERVINSSGVESIHDSFLFPINKKGYYLWIWESVEESKATYIFKTTSSKYLNDVQNIYDFLTSELKNKRFSLIRDKVSTGLPLIKRIKHTDFREWKNQIHLYTNQQFQII